LLFHKTQKIRTWFNNYARSQKNQQPQGEDEDDKDNADNAEESAPRLPPGYNKFLKSYKLRDAVPVVCKDEVEKEMECLSNGVDSSRSRLKFYPTAITKVLESLKGDKLKEVQKMVEVWNLEGAPQDIQIK
jgi:hypothetical protein